MQRTQIVIDKNLHNAPLGGGKGTSRADSTCATGLLVGKLKLGSQLCQIFSLAARDTSRLDQDLDPLLIEKVRCITCALTAPTSDAKEFPVARTHLWLRQVPRDRMVVWSSDSSRRSLRHFRPQSTRGAAKDRPCGYRWQSHLT